MLSYYEDGIEVSVNFNDYIGDYDRCSWVWSIEHVTAPKGERVTLATGTDLQTWGYRPVEALKALISFLSAWAEGGESADLFPASLNSAPVDWDSWTGEAYCDLDAGEDD